MEIENSVAFVTGANRGIGQAFVAALQRRGAVRIYAAARDAATLHSLAGKDPKRIIPVALDITNTDQVRDAARNARDVNLLINNAGIAEYTRLVGVDTLDAARSEMDVNYFGTLAMIRAFAPLLGANGGGAIINVLSIASLINFPMLGSYSASKAAAHSLTQGTRAELSVQKTLVIGVYPGPVDTDMAASLKDLEKAQPADIADAALRAVIEKREDVFPDAMAAGLQTGLQEDPKAIERQVAEMALAY